MKKVTLLTTIFFMMLIGVVSGAQLVVDTVGTYDTPQKMMQAADDNFDELYGAFASLAAFESFLTGAGAYASDILGVENEAGLVGLFSNYVDQDVTSGSTPTFVDLPIATSLDGTVANLMTALSDEGTWAATVLGWADASAARTSLGLVIGTNVLAEQTIGIADDNLLKSMMPVLLPTMLQSLRLMASRELI
jgi:hypothetical protein